MSAPTSVAAWNSPTSTIPSVHRSSATPCARLDRSLAAKPATIGNSNQVLLGLEADVSWADLYGTNTCFAFSGFYVSGNCSSEVDALGTFTGRFGWLLGSDRGTLIYARPAPLGSTVKSRRRSAAARDFPPRAPAASAGVGRSARAPSGPCRSAGRSRRSTTTLSFGSEGLTAPPSAFQSVPSPDPLTLTPVAATGTDFSQDAHLLKVGLNYRLDDGASGARRLERVGASDRAHHRNDARDRCPLRLRLGTLPEGSRHSGRGIGFPCLAAHLRRQRDERRRDVRAPRHGIGAGWRRASSARATATASSTTKIGAFPSPSSFPTRTRFPRLTTTYAMGSSTSATMCGAMNASGRRRSSATAFSISTCRGSAARRSPIRTRIAERPSPRRSLPSARTISGRRCVWAPSSIFSSRPG